MPAPNKYPVYIPRDPATSSFQVVTREVWAHRDLPAADDSEYPDVCTQQHQSFFHTKHKPVPEIFFFGWRTQGVEGPGHHLSSRKGPIQMKEAKAHGQREER